MKMFAVLALAAVAFAEPEAQVVYRAGVTGVPVSTVYNTPYSTYGSSPLLRAFTPYSAFNGVYGSRFVHSIGKRDADADAAVYTTGLPVSTYGAVAGVSPVVYSGVHHPVSTYGAVNPFVAANHVVSPVSYNAVNHFAAPVSTYVAAPVSTHSLTSYNNPSHYTAVSNGAFGPKYIAKNHGVEHVVKRDAEPLLYSAVNPVAYSGVHHPVASHVVPATYAASHVVPATYTAGHVVPATYAAGHVVKGAYAPHAVAATPFGLTHSSNVGVCTNNVGVQVPC